MKTFPIKKEKEDQPHFDEYHETCRLKEKDEQMECLHKDEKI
jgi:hypothetical protein